MRARYWLPLPLVLVVPALVPHAIDGLEWANRQRDLAQGQNRQNPRRATWRSESWG
jgi:hypothetical protein